MEDYLQSQVSTGDYDLLANLAILKLYQFNPQLSNPDVIINILTKALVATVHGPDFNVCLALLREPAAILQDIDSDEDSFTQTMPFLQRLHDLVRACQFTKFWAEFNGSSEAATLLRSSPNYFSAHKDFIPKLRHQFASSIAASFRRVRLSQLSRWLDLQEKELAAWCKEAGWEIEGDVAVVPKNGDNDVKAGVVKENVQLKRECGIGSLLTSRAYKARCAGCFLGVDYAWSVHLAVRLIHLEVHGGQVGQLMSILGWKAGTASSLASFYRSDSVQLRIQRDTSTTKLCREFDPLGRCGWLHLDDRRRHTPLAKTDDAARRTGDDALVVAIH